MVGREAVAMRRATVPCTAAPVTATKHSERPGSSTLRVGLRIAAITSVPILTPLPYIAAHIVNAKFIRLLGLNWMCTIFTILPIPCHIVDIIAAAIFIAAAIVAASGCIFPFRLGGQAEILTRHCVQFLNKLLTIVPRHLFDRKVITPKPAWIIVHHCLP